MANINVYDKIMIENQTKDNMDMKKILHKSQYKRSF